MDWYRKNGESRCTRGPLLFTDKSRAYIYLIWPAWPMELSTEPCLDLLLEPWHTREGRKEAVVVLLWIVDINVLQEIDEVVVRDIGGCTANELSTSCAASAEHGVPHNGLHPF